MKFLSRKIKKKQIKLSFVSNKNVILKFHHVIDNFLQQWMEVNYQNGFIHRPVAEDDRKISISCVQAVQ